VMKLCERDSSSLVGVGPLLGRKEIVGGSRTPCNIASKSSWGDQRLIRAENTEHVLDESTNFVGLAFFLLVDVLEVRNRVHDLGKAAFQILFRLLQDGQQLFHFVERAFGLDAFGRFVQDSHGFFFRQKGLVCRGGSDHRRSHWAERSRGCKKEGKDGSGQHAGVKGL
jgi:hypothetical protein